MYDKTPSEDKENQIVFNGEPSISMPPAENVSMILTFEP